ncbi:hypothetical protein NB706_002595 [Xanthomonas sacchari]|nr:hypothetical protein [Xanthomonas sacchari]
MRRRLVVDVRHRQGGNVLGMEGRGLHPQRASDQITDQLRQRLPTGGLQHRTGDVDRQGIAPAAARRVPQRYLSETAQVFLQAQATGVHAIGNAGARERATGGFKKAVTQPGAVAEQLAQADVRHPAVGQGGAEPRQPACDRRIQAQAALRHQCQRRGGDDRLADRGQAKTRLLMHRPLRLAVGPAGGAAVDAGALMGDKHHRTDQPLLLQGGVDRGIQRRGLLGRQGRQRRGRKSGGGGRGCGHGGSAR